MVGSYRNIGNDAPLDQLLLKDRALASAAEGITIANALAPDRPLIYVNEGFSRLTGYDVEEVLGCNCRFLQGPDTDPAAVEEIRNAIAEMRYCDVELLNYRKDGTTFWNHLSITPIQDGTGQTTHFIGIQSDVTRRRLAEQSLRALNQSLKNANDRMQSDLRAAARIQQALLPTGVPELSQATIGWAYLPCEELAGDILDVFELDDQRLAFYVLDVSGHGVQAALLSTTLSRWLARSSPALKADPVAILENLNRNFQLDATAPQFFTCSYGVLDPQGRTLQIASAGHPCPILLRQGQASEIQLSGFPVGVVAQPEYELEVIQLQAGDRLYLYSDGAVEQPGPDGICIGIAGLMRELNCRRDEPLQTSIDSSLAAVLRGVAEDQTEDDISMLGIEIGQ